MSKYAVMKKWRWWAALPVLVVAHYVGNAAELVFKAMMALGDSAWRFINGSDKQ